MVSNKPLDNHVKFAAGDSVCTAVIVTSEETALLQSDANNIPELDLSNCSNDSTDGFNMSTSSSHTPSVDAKPGPPILRHKRQSR